MTPEEAKIIRDVFERLKAMGPPPRDPDAQRAVETELKNNPDAGLGLVRAIVALDQERTALMQDRGEREKRIAELEQQLADRNRSGGLFGPGPGQAPAQGYAPAGSVPPIPQGGYGQQGYAPPQPQRGPWGSAPQQDPGYGQMPSQGLPGQGQGGGFFGGGQGQGGSFLGSAMRTAAGVAGGMFAFEAVKGLFGGHSGGMFGGSAMAAPVVQETIIEHIPVYDRADPGSGPFGLADSRGGQGGFDTGGSISDTGYDVASDDFGGGGDDDDFA